MYLQKPLVTFDSRFHPNEFIDFIGNDSRTIISHRLYPMFGVLGARRVYLRIVAKNQLVGENPCQLNTVKWNAVFLWNEIKFANWMKVFRTAKNSAANCGPLCHIKNVRVTSNECDFEWLNFGESTTLRVIFIFDIDRWGITAMKLFMVFFVVSPFIAQCHSR